MNGLLYAVAVLALYFASTTLFERRSLAAFLPFVFASFAGALFANRLGFKSIAGTAFGGGIGCALGCTIPLATRNAAMDVATFFNAAGVGFLLGVFLGVIFAYLLAWADARRRD